ncbi:PREDICTED: splicing factor 3B subunit 2 [Haliaeetus leucocephalus]|uniref:splicing factor 3B subunit 2 n=1 Tax=Haliaeetus leucocephalus TaxID=52644 RepID=UPI00053CB9E0|nr:PREDICTED: splicing factor 3B subunit 2 [Haliaeetus leucocephalus]
MWKHCPSTHGCSGFPSPPQGQHPFGDKAKEQELLEQQKRAAVLLEQERQQEMAKLAPAVPRPPPDVAPMGARAPLPPRGSTPMGAPISGVPMGAPRPRGPPPPPGEESREPDDPTVGPKIPQALEKILQLKEIRQEELITVPGLSAEDEMETEPRASASASEAEEDAGLSKKERNRKRRNRKKKKRGRGAVREGAPTQTRGDPETPGDTPAVEIEYVTEEPEIYDPNFVFFKRIFEAFKLTDDVKKDKEKEPDKADRAESATVPKKKGFEDGHKGSEDDSSEDEQEKKPEVPKLSKKKLRRMNRFTVAELKQLVARPDVVEMHDVTAQDPKLLVHLKATRNSVPVPRHWCFKRKYLQGKRGIEKPPFELPDFIKRTGIQEMREALQEKEEQKTMKSKMREKVRPKMGKIDIDYQKLHDAFFKWQTKPKLTIHGDLYYEGKEFETRLKEKKPGDLSDELRIALGMPVGPVSRGTCGSETPQLFTVVPEKRTATVGTAMMGSTHIYDMSAVMGRKGPVPEAQGVEVALAPEELELDPTAMTQKYEEHVREQQAQVEKEDFSDMVAEHAAKQKQKKRKAQPQDARGGGKKYKEFKF